MKLRAAVAALAALAVLSILTVVLALWGSSDWLFVALAFIVGVCVGVAFDDAWDLYRASRRDNPNMTDRHPHETTAQTTARHRFNSQTALGWSLLIASIAMLAVGVLLITTKNTTESYSKCTAEWQQQFGEAYTARVDAAREVSDAMDAIVLSVSGSDRTAFHKAVADYLYVRDRQKADQAENPLPPLPEVLCGER